MVCDGSSARNGKLASAAATAQVKPDLPQRSDSTRPSCGSHRQHYLARNGTADAVALCPMCAHKRHSITVHDAKTARDMASVARERLGALPSGVRNRRKSHASVENRSPW